MLRLRLDLKPDAPPLAEAHKHLLRRYGNHTRTCAKQQWFDSLKVRPATSGLPECDCGWLEVLEAACKGEEELRDAGTSETPG